MLARLVAEAALIVMPPKGGEKAFNVDNVRVVKILGGGLEGSRVIKGMVFGRESEGAYRFLRFHPSLSSVFCLRSI
jgi:T-complex protein 1 subunit theta